MTFSVPVGLNVKHGSTLLPERAVVNPLTYVFPPGLLLTTAVGLSRRAWVEIQTACCAKPEYYQINWTPTALISAFRGKA